MNHYAKSILFSDCFSRELAEGEYQTSYLNLHNDHAVIRLIYIYIYIYMKSSFPKRYKSILIVFMKMTFFYLDP